MTIKREKGGVRFRLDCLPFPAFMSVDLVFRETIGIELSGISNGRDRA